MKKCKDVGHVRQMSHCVWKWTIKHYSSYLLGRKNRLLSANFSAVQSGITTNWRLEAYPNGKNDGCTDFLSVYLTNLDDTDVKTTYEFSILDDIDRVIFVSPIFAQVFGAARTTPRTWGRSKFVSHAFLNDTTYRVLTNDTLILQYRILIDRELSAVENIDVDLLRDDFQKLLNIEKHSDVTFIIGEEKMHVHKAILASRSPVFEAMFEYDMKENQQNTVTITDVNLMIVREMCRYIYTGRVCEINSASKDLFIAADKYCIEGLKILCEKTICKQLTNDNVLEYLQLARTYNAKILKPKVYEFVKKHIREIYPMPEFKALDSDIKDEIMGIIIGVKSVE